MIDLLQGRVSKSVFACQPLYCTHSRSQSPGLASSKNLAVSYYDGDDDDNNDNTLVNALYTIKGSKGNNII